MSGLRERKKEETRSRILNAAMQMFLARGFRDTTTAGIAKTAEIAEGTIYNYYRSKGEILISIIYRSMFQNEYRFGAEYRDPQAEIFRCLDHYLSPAEHISKDLLRDLYSVAFGQSGESEYIFSRLREFDLRIIGSIRRYIMSMPDFRRRFDGPTLGYFLENSFALVMYYFSKYILSVEMSYRDFFEELKAALTVQWNPLFEEGSL